MAMRETAGSLRAYLIIGAILSSLIHLSSLAQSGGNLLAILLSLIGLGFSFAYFYMGIALKKLLERAPGFIVKVLMAGACYLLIIFLLSLATDVWAAALVRLVLGLLITWYLIRNVRRLSGQAPSVPTA
jgi:hypothetical protein